MRNMKAIFKKQLKATLKSPETMVQFIIYPVLAFVILLLITTEHDGYVYGYAYLSPEAYEAARNTIQMVMDAINEAMPNMVTMQATIFAGMAVIPVVAAIIAEDIEKKSLRFLMMAGVKPMSYLIGISGVMLLASFATSSAFSLIAGFRGEDFWIFTAAMMAGVVASIIIGALIAILVKNVQSTQALSMPLAIILGFGPFLAQFNDTAARVLHPIFTQHINVVADYLDGVRVDVELWQSFAIIGANVLVFGVLFAVVYRKKGMKE